MHLISNIIFFLGILVMLTAPLLFVIFIILWCLRKRKLWVGIATLICALSAFPLMFIGAALDPSTWCNHEYTIVEEIPATCQQQGKIVQACPLCKDKHTEYLDKIDHLWVVSQTIEATCSQKGSVNRTCSLCGYIEIQKTEKLDHSWVVNQTIEATCSQKGSVERTCSLCGHTETQQTEKIDHSWNTVSTVPATCTKDGYTVDSCSLCSATRENKLGSALGHSMQEVSRTEPTYESDGITVSRCDRCGYEESVTTEKLTIEPITFNGLELSFGQYSFTKVDNIFSEHHGETVVKIPVTIKNTSSDPHSLNLFSYQLFGTSGAESDDIWYYFPDDVSQGGDLLPNSSYTKYFHILYDGDGTYTIVFDLLFDEQTVQILVKK